MLAFTGGSALQRIKKSDFEREAKTSKIYEVSLMSAEDD